MSSWFASLVKAIVGAVALALVVVVIVVSLQALGSGRSAARSQVASAPATTPTVAVDEDDLVPSTPVPSAVPSTPEARAATPSPSEPAPLGSPTIAPYPGPIGSDEPAPWTPSVEPYPPPPAYTPIPPPTLAPTLVPLTPPASPVELAGLKSGYVYRDLVATSWGTGPGQIGLVREVAPPQGPKSFDVDSAGNVYILDSVNHRVNKYDGKGAFISSFSFGPSVHPFDMAVWKDGSVFFADEGDQTVKKFDQSGKLLLVYDIGKWPDDIYHVERVQFDASGTVWVEAQYGLGGNITVVNAGTVDTPASREQVLGSRRKGFMFSGVYYIEGRLARTADGKAGTLLLDLGDGKSLRLDIPALAGTVVGPGPLALDGQGNLYIQVAAEIADRNTMELFVLKYGPDAKLLDFMQLPTDAFYSPPDRPYRVDQFGNFYDLMTFEDGVKVGEWEPGQ